MNYSDFIPKVEEKRNKKNESIINFAHRIDLQILDNMKERYQRKRGGSNNLNGDVPKDQIFTLGQLQDDVKGFDHPINQTAVPISDRLNFDESESHLPQN